MDYEKKYKEAIARLKQWDKEHPNGYSIQERDEFIFPELKESEDERIRKELICFLDAEIPQCEARDKYIAWLEKQEEQKPQGKSALEAAKEEKIDNANKAEPKFKVGDLVKYTNHNKQPIYKVNHIDKECYICTSDDATLGDKAVMHFAFDNPYLRLVEQKPDWSEKFIADVFEKVGLAKIVREQSNDSLTNALQDAMIELSKFFYHNQSKSGVKRMRRCIM